MITLDPKPTARLGFLLAGCACLLGVPAAHGVTNVFFNAAQTATLVVSNITTKTIRTGDYLFTSSVDGYWSPVQGGVPTGRFHSVFWPNGVDAQAITTGPDIGKGANILLKREDGKPFDLMAFTGKILANTAGAGAMFEIMPVVAGEDALPDPVMFNATGYGGQSFSHTPALRGYDTYKIHLWVDYAITALTLIDTNAIAPTNAPPLAFGSGFCQLTGQPLAINLADLMSSDFDPDGDPITFVGVSATSSNGLALTTNASQILVPANAVADGFSYTIADSHGATAIGAAMISIITNVTSRGISLARAPDGSATISFTGVPWYSYECQRATNATFTGAVQTWPVQAWADGSILVWDDFADLANKPSQAFYRLRSTP